MIPFRGGHEGKGDASVSTRRLDDDHARLQGSTLLSILNHGHADAVFHASEGIKKFALESDSGRQSSSDPIKLHKGSAANCLDDVVVNVAHKS